MNIFKKIAFANKTLKAVEAVKKYNEANHLTDDTKKHIENIKSEIAQLCNQVPAYRALVELIKDLL